MNSRVLSYEKSSIFLLYILNVTRYYYYELNYSQIPLYINKKVFLSNLISNLILNTFRFCSTELFTYNQNIIFSKISIERRQYNRKSQAIIVRIQYRDNLLIYSLNYPITITFYLSRRSNNRIRESRRFTVPLFPLNLVPSKGRGGNVYTSGEERNRVRHKDVFI